MDLALHDFEMSDSETELLLNPVNRQSSMAKRDYTTTDGHSRNRRRNRFGIRSCFRMLCG